MTTHYRTPGLILDKRDFRESDRFFTIFTKKYGKIEALARGERKIKSKLRGGLELFYLSEVQFVQGRHWKTLVDASLQENFSNIREDLSKLRVASKIAEVSTKLIRGQEKHPEIWNLLLRTFKELDSNSHKFLTYHYFFWRLVSHLGYKPQLEQCSICHNDLTPTQLYFDAEQGGVVCSNCNESSSRRVSSDIVKIMRVILNGDWETLTRLNLKLEQKQDLQELSALYYTHLKYL